MGQTPNSCSSKSVKSLTRQNCCWWKLLFLSSPMVVFFLKEKMSLVKTHKDVLVFIGYVNQIQTHVTHFHSDWPDTIPNSRWCLKKKVYTPLNPMFINIPFDFIDEYENTSNWGLATAGSIIPRPEFLGPWDPTQSVARRRASPHRRGWHPSPGRTQRAWNW